jgi:hypothetical protein
MFGLGVYGADFVTGARAESDRLLGERQKLALAFQQFKAQNPEANYADFRQFIDGVTNGDSYLRGALPTDDILQRLGQDGEKRKREADAARASAAMTARLNQQKMLNEMLGSAYEAGVDRDPNKYKEYVFKTANIADPNDQAAIGAQIDGMNLTGWLDRRDREEADNVIGKLGSGIRDGIIVDETSLKSSLPKYFEKSPLFEGTQRTLGTMLNTTLENKTRSAMAEAVRLGSDLSQDINPDTVMQLVTGIYGGNANHPAVKSTFNQLWSAAQRRRAEEQRSRDLQRRAQEQALAQQERAAQQQARQQAFAIPGLLQAAARGDSATVNRYLRAYQVQANVGDIMASAPAILQTQQYSNNQQARAAARAGAPKAVDDAFVLGAKIAEKNFSEKTPLGTSIPGFSVAMRALAAERRIDPTDAARIAELAQRQKQNLLKMSPVEMKDYVARQLSGVLETRDDLQRNYIDTADSMAQSQRFDDFVTTGRNNLLGAVQDARGDLRKIASLPPLEREEAINQRLVSTQQIISERARVIGDLARNYETWLDPYGPNYDQAAMQSVFDDANREFKALVREAEAIKALPDPQAKTQAAPPPRSRQPLTHYLAPFNPVVDAIAGHQKSVEARDRALAARNTRVLGNPNAKPRANFVTR